MSVRSRSNWNLAVLVFEERGKPEYPEKNLSEQGREPTNQPTYGVDAGIWTRATLVGGERSHHCATSAPAKHGVVPEDIHAPSPPPPKRRALLFWTPTLLRKCLLYPSFPWNSRKFSILAGYPWKGYISVKTVVTLCYYAKCNCFCDKVRKKNLFILIHGLVNSIIPCRGLS